MRKKLDSKVEEHIHRDLDVTYERVKAFGKAKHPIRIQVLATLRWTAGDQSLNTVLAISAIVVALAFWILKPVGVDLQAMPWLVAMAAGVGLSLVLILGSIPILAIAGIGQGRQERAKVWLAAYEDEIQRRASRTRK